MEKILYLASILNPQSDTRCDYIENGALLLSYSRAKKRWLISDLGTMDSVVARIPKTARVEVVDWQGLLLTPSFFDIHFHWVQDDVRMMPKDSLLEWLDQYTFPAENRFRNKAYSKQEARRFFSRLAQAGTLGGACYSSVHGHALEDAQNHVVGDFVIGNVLMTMQSPDCLQQTKTHALHLVDRFTKKYEDRYAMTPRFAPTTHPDVMKKAALMARQHGSFIQSHLSETKDEIDYVMSIYRSIPGYENANHYTDIYRRAGILSKRTIMGHGIYLSDEEMNMLAKTGTAIAHCPTSNAPIRDHGLGSGLCDIRRLSKHGVRWALASDIGGGPYLSMLDVMESFVTQHQKAKVRSATYTQALFRSTLAGADILGLKKTHGNFSKGKEANFLVFERPQKGKSAEEILKNMIHPFRNARAKYDDLVIAAFYRGERV